MVEDQELIYRIALTLIPGVGDVLAKKLIACCGSVEAVFAEKQDMLLRIHGVGPVVSKSIRNRESFLRAEKEVRFLQRYSIKPLFYLDSDYPERLKQCEDHPTMIYYKGTADLNHVRPIAVVGTRRVTEYGKIECKKIIDGLAPFEPMVVSGLAYGVDTCAHKSSLEAGLFTIGVLGHGLDRIYPSQNKQLAGKMLNQGGLITEFVSETKPDAENFPRRNRIIAGLCDAVVVIEAGLKGGALITADIANSYNRDVFALPGRVTDFFSEGCHFLIKTNRAALIENAADLVYAMGWQANNNGKAPQLKLFEELTDEEEKLVHILKEKGDVSVDTFVNESNMASGKVASLLLNLEFKGVIKLLPGKVYRLI
ncbi:MAG: DNA-processing protein DprA [Bacteroidota bacterium]|nr:DNA-processing protein DprA [Bacteroidota bacterium]